ncbi:ComEC/Rec2 family competence protein [Candidatus Mycoplasma mahonii]|nr:ComEC/Rec2 family competence protein [Candidatus Mycoplasma mahonii]WKX02543.1 ComEC/Rec2 family competence protein [Candidatus Mycoplasma mahonii]
MYFQRQEKMHQSINGIFEIKKIISSGYIIKANGNNVLISTKKHFELFDEIRISGQIETPTNFNGAKFDFVSYLKTLNIENIIKFPKISLASHSGDIRTKSLSFLTIGPSEYTKVAPLVMLGVKTNAAKDIYQMSIRLSVVHLFVISGFHISFLYLLVGKILKIMKIDKYTNPWMPLFMILIYLFLINFPLSASRAFILILLLNINKKLLKNRFTSMEILAIVICLMFLYKPYSIKSLSFIYTFLATGTVLYINSFKFKSDLMKYLSISIIVYFITVPISIYINHFFAPLGILMGIIFTPIMMMVYTLSIFLFPFKDVMNQVYIVFVWLLKVMDGVNPLVKINLSLFIIQILYLIALSSFIIWRLWYLFTEKNNILLIKN